MRGWRNVVKHGAASAVSTAWCSAIRRWMRSRRLATHSSMLLHHTVSGETAGLWLHPRPGWPSDRAYRRMSATHSKAGGHNNCSESELCGSRKLATAGQQAQEHLPASCPIMLGGNHAAVAMPTPTIFAAARPYVVCDPLHPPSVKFMQRPPCAATKPCTQHPLLHTHTHIRHSHLHQLLQMVRLSPRYLHHLDFGAGGRKGADSRNSPCRPCSRTAPACINPRPPSTPTSSLHTSCAGLSRVGAVGVGCGRPEGGGCWGS